MTVGEEILETYSHEETAYHLQNSENERTVPNLFETVREQSNICTIRNWKNADLQRWIFHSFMNNIVDSNFAAENFLLLSEDETSRLLREMNINDFIRLDPKFGKQLHHRLMEYERSRNKHYCDQSFSDITISSDSSLSSESSIPFIPKFQMNQKHISNFIVKNNHAQRIGDGKIKKLGKKTKDCVHVWQFCRDLLNNKDFNPNVIQWVDQKNLVFKIINKEAIAYEWGKKKNRKDPGKMTYENMSRGMRHSRVASDYFRVPDKKWKKKFVYQFGDKAIESCQFLQNSRNGIIQNN